MSSTTIIAVVTTCVITGLYIIYRLALPTPIPGIPYNAEAAKSIWGDVPSLQAEMSHGGDFIKWLGEQNHKSRSVLSQVFLRPFSKPLVLLADYREARDIQVHRYKDFDRDYRITQAFGPLVNSNQFTLRTGPEWRMHRRLVQDTMSPSFLHDVAAPSIYASSLRFIDLWNSKVKLAHGRPFSAMDDVFHATFDAVLAFTFGSEFPHSATMPQAQRLANVCAEDMMSDLTIDDPVKFAKVELDAEIGSMLSMVDYMEKVQSKLSPALTWLYFKNTPTFRRLRKIKDDCIRRQIHKAIENRIQNASNTDQARVRNAVDHIVDREYREALKEGRKPNFFAPMVFDEIYGFLVAGHDTTSSTLCWALKLLTDYPVIQSRLRKSLQSAFSDALSQGRLPSAREITGTSVPYLDAVMEEIFRVGNATPIGSREAIRDTVLLGRLIPRGTIVMYLKKGPGLLSPALSINESIRSKSSQEDKAHGKTVDWNEDDIGLFKPERWLKKGPSIQDARQIEQKASAEESWDSAGFVFDRNAGPVNTFGMGIRGCFGRRLAYVEFRILLTLLIWNFELLDCPEELSSYRGKLSLVYKPRECFVRPKRVTNLVIS